MHQPDKTLRRSGRADELQRQVEKMMRRLRVAVIFGGDKNSEGAVINPAPNTRSWKSYEAVAHDIATALKRIGCRDVFVMPEDMRLAEHLRAEKIHLAWLNSGGVQGFGSVTHGPAMLEMLGIPYVGHDPLSAGLLDNKHIFKRQLKALGLPTAPFMTWHPAQGVLNLGEHALFQREFRHWDGQFIVKPVSGRASLNVNYVERAANIPAIASQVYEITQNQVLIEGYLPGREYCVAVCGPVIRRDGKLERNGGPFTFAEIERVLEPGESIFTSMDIKPITAERVRQLDEDAEAEVISRLRRLGRDVYEALSLDSIIRMDVRADHRGSLFVLEANPKPDLKAPAENVTSLIGEGLIRYGMTYDDLIYSLLADRIDSALSRGRGAPGALTTLF